MFALIENGAVAKYPYSVRQLRADNPQTSFPEAMSMDALAEWGVLPVYPTDAPQVDHTKNVTEGDPELIDGSWVQVWVVADATEEQVAERETSQWNEVRADRNNRLAACDWTQLPDCPLPNDKQVEWASYRQGLRDITLQADPFNITWPTEPA